MVHRIRFRKRMHRRSVHLDRVRIPGFYDRRGSEPVNQSCRLVVTVYEDSVDEGLYGEVVPSCGTGHGDFDGFRRQRVILDSRSPRTSEIRSRSDELDFGISEIRSIHLFGNCRRTESISRRKAVASIHFISFLIRSGSGPSVVPERSSVQGLGPVFRCRRRRSRRLCIEHHREHARRKFSCT